MCVSGDSPVYELVLLQVLAALSDVSSYVEEVHHGQTGWVLLITEANARDDIRGKTALHKCRSQSHRSGSGLSQEGFQVSSRHQFQQDEPGHSLKTDSHTPHNVLVTKFTTRTEVHKGKLLVVSLAHSKMPHYANPFWTVTRALDNCRASNCLFMSPFFSCTGSKSCVEKKQRASSEWSILRRACKSISPDD